MDEISEPKFTLNRSDVHRKYTRGSGNGGQKRNKVETVCVLTHIPTGIIVRCEEHRTRDKNEEAAWKRLEERLKNIQIEKTSSQIQNARLDQIGFGNRNNKRRTYREQDGYVLDHVTDKKITIKDLYKGNIKQLHA